MQTNKPTMASDILLILAPPVRLVNWLETVFEQKRKKGEEVPANFLAWLERWHEIRAGLPSKIDLLTAEEWEQLKELAF